MSNGGPVEHDRAWAGLPTILRTAPAFFSQALEPNRLGLALLGVLICYSLGRGLDAMWPGSSAVLVGSDGVSEIAAFGRRDVDFHGWRAAARQAYQTAQAEALVAADVTTDVAAGRELLRSRPLATALNDAAYRKDLVELERKLAERLTGARLQIEANPNLNAREKAERRTTLERAGDRLRTALLAVSHGIGRSDDRQHFEAVAAAELIWNANDQLAVDARAEELRRLITALEARAAVADAAEFQPRPPFAAFIAYQSHCMAAAIQGLCALRWGLGEGPDNPNPTLLGSVAAAGNGWLWLITQRSWFGGIWGLASVIVWALIGGAICRSAALQSARAETLGGSAALKFAWGKRFDLLIAPLVPFGLFLGIGILIAAAALLFGGLSSVLVWLGGVLAAIPAIGWLLALVPYLLAGLLNVLMGILFVAALLGGLALALIGVAAILGFNLIIPVVAVENADPFEGMTRACSYVGSRPWKVVGYLLFLLIGGGFALALFRLVAVLTLKLTHTFVGYGLNLFAADGTQTLGRLDAIWQMPAWAEIGLLPGAGRWPIWGTFQSAPLDTIDTLLMWLICAWVFVIVGLIAAFMMNLYFCASTQVYLHLRRDIDSTELDEVYVEDGEAPAAPLATVAPPAPAEPAYRGTALPVMGGPSAPPNP